MTVVPARSDRAKDNNWLRVIADICRLALAYGPVNIQVKLGLDGLAFEIGSRPTEGGEWALTVHCAELADQNMELLSDALALAIQSPTVNVERQWSGQRGRFLYAATAPAQLHSKQWQDVAVAAIWVLIAHHHPVYTEPQQITVNTGVDEPQHFTVARGFIDPGPGSFTEVRVTGSDITGANRDDVAALIGEAVVEQHVATGQLVNFRPWKSHEPATVQFQFCTQVIQGQHTSTAHPRYPRR